MVKLLVPEILLKYTCGEKELQFSSNNYNDFVSELKNKMPQLFDALYSQKNELNGYVAIYKNKKQIDTMDEKCIFTTDDIMEIIIPLSGG